MKKTDKIFVAGHKGMVGSAVVRRLEKEGYNILSVDRKEVDLTRQGETEEWLNSNSPDIMVIAAARVGGIMANSSYPAEFIYENAAIESNLIHGAWKADVKKVLFLGSSCIYPKFAGQPIAEEELLSGALEPSNEWYAIAKIAGLKMIQAYRKQYGVDFISAMPTNLYGPGDNFDLNTSHVLPALMRKIHDAKTNGETDVRIWGTGSPLRDFLHVDDLADSILFLLKNYSSEMPINIGSGRELTIRDLGELLKEVIGYKGGFSFDASKPDGTPRKILDISKITSLGWKPGISFREGIKMTYEWYLRNEASLVKE